MIPSKSSVFGFPTSVLLACSLLTTVAQAQSNYATPYYFTTLAGSVNVSGTADGMGNAARFNTPVGVAVSADGIAYVADMNSHTIRKITPYGNVTTLAGQPGVSGPSTTNGTGSAARFNLPRGVAVDSAGNVYVGDTSNHAIRKITPGGAVTTLAGGTAGALDGTGTGARFSSPSGVAVDSAGNVYVADAANNSIRRISPTGVVTTLAGGLSPTVFGSADGTGASARFGSPRGVAVDSSGNVYVADRDNNLIRKVSPAGVVTTLAGVANGTTGSADGTGSAARFNSPYGVAVDGGGNVYVSEGGNHTVRKITPAGVVTTLAGSPGAAVGSATDVTGSAVRFSQVQGIAVDGDGNLYASDTDNHTIRMSVFPPLFTLHPASQTVLPGGTLFFTAAAKSNVPIFGARWERNSTMDFLPYVATWNPGQTLLTTELFQTPVEASQLGTYVVIATNMAGSSTSNVATLSFPISTAGRLINLSILTTIPASGDSFTMGYVVGGGGTVGNKPLVIRAVGPTLGAAPFSIPGTLADPKIELFAGATKTGDNDNWGGAAATSAAMASVGAFPFAGPTSLDAAAVANITTANNSVIVSATGAGTGTVIAEIYDATPPSAFLASTPRLLNVSVLKHLGTGLTAGFVIGGLEPKTVLIRAIGPTLGSPPFNVGGVVVDPQLTLFSGATVIGTNDNWGGTVALTAAFTQVGAFGLPATSRDAALLATNLAPGNYTVQVSGVGGTTGIAIVEVYDVP